MMAEFPALPTRRGDGFVYFLLARDNVVRPMVKIGFSLRAPDRRLLTCQTGSPIKLEMIAFLTGSMSTERDLHKRFAALRSHNEWFFYEDELREYVEELAA